MKQLRDYQSKCIETIHSKLNQGVSRQLVAMATGTGKTFMAVRATSMFAKRLWITHEETLLEQSGTAFLHELYPNVDIQIMIDTHGGLSDYIKAVKSMGIFSDLPENEIVRNIGIIKAEAFDIESDIVLASAQTLHRRLDRIRPEQFDSIIFDECHLAMAKTYSKAVNYFQPKLLLGITATPHRADGASLGDMFDEITYQYNLAQAIQDGYLCEIDALAIQTKINIDSVRTTAGEFNQKDLKQTVDTPERNKLIVEKYKLYADGKQTLVFCVDVEHAQNVCSAFIKAGYKAEYAVGDQNLTPDRKAVVNRFKTKQTQILVNVMLFTAGFDYPGIEALVLACPTKSLTKFMQQVGRCTRTLPGVINGFDSPETRIKAIKASSKPKAVVLDIVDTTSRHRMINTWTLDKDVSHEKKVFVTSERREMLIGARNKREFEAKRKADKRVDLFKLPKVKLSTSIKMTNPATEAQLTYLKNLGYDTEQNTYTKGTANQIISAHPATEKQIKFLAWKKFDVSQGVTIGEAQLAFNLLKEQEEKSKEKKEIGVTPIDGLF